MEQNQYKKQFLATFHDLTRRYDKHRVFTDFVTMMSITLSQATQAIGGVKKDEQEEKVFLDIERQYKQKVIQGPFTKLFAATVLGLEHEKGDWLGEIYSELNLGNSSLGQFFTPFHVSKLMAKLVLGDQNSIHSEIRKKGYVTLSEPTCGSGGMVLAFAEVFRETGLNSATQLFVVAQDISSTAACMCHIQLSLCGIPALVQNKDSLSFEPPFWARYTPAFYLMGWPFKLMRKSGAREETPENKQDVEDRAVSKTKQPSATDKKPKKSLLTYFRELF